MRNMSFFLHQSLEEVSLVSTENVRMFCKFLDLFSFQMMFLTVTVTAKNMKKYYLGKRLLSLYFLEGQVRIC